MCNFVKQDLILTSVKNTDQELTVFSGKIAKIP